MSTPRSELRLGRAPFRMARTRAATLPHGSLGGGGGGDRLREGHHGELVVGPHERLRAAGGVQCVEWSVGLGQKPGWGGSGVMGGAARSWVPAAHFAALSWDSAGRSGCCHGELLPLAEPWIWVWSRSAPRCPSASSGRLLSPSRLPPSGSQPPASFAAASVPPKTQIPIWPVSAGCAVVYHGWQRRV